MSFAVFSVILLSLFHQGISASKTNTPASVAAAWYTGSHATKGFPLSDVRWAYYNTLIYSFAMTTPEVNSLSLNGSEPSLLPEFVRIAHKNNVAAHISIGGRDGGRWFSSNLATPENRTAFVHTVTCFAEEHSLDGINFDWEYPGKQGIGCNTISVHDTANFLSFLHELRANPIGANLTLSAATPITPFRDAKGNPSKDVSGFAKVLDYITIMNYDVWGPWSAHVGPNSPLNDECAAPAHRKGSAVSAVKAWNAAGMPLDQIVLGVASYGHSYSVLPSDAFVHGSSTELAPYPKFKASNQPLGDAWGNTSRENSCGVHTRPSGTFRLWGLVEDGFLTPQSGKPAPGIYYRYDDCSQTPYVYNKTSGVMVSFEDARSFIAKGNYIHQTGLKGFAMWEAGGDFNGILIDSILG